MSRADGVRGNFGDWLDRTGGVVGYRVLRGVARRAL
jgi:hypothetical protein